VTRFAGLFSDVKPLIGMIALQPSPGYPGFTTVDAVIETALADLRALELGGADAVLVENDFDQPHTLTVDPAVVAMMTRVTREVATRAKVPVGVEVLLDDWRASLGVAAAAGASFIRVDFFVDRVISKLGLIEPDPAALLAYRATIRAEHVLLFTDLQVKYSTVVDGPKPIEQSARQAAAAGADAVVITGSETGVAPREADLVAARAGGLPVLVGSGTSPDNVETFASLADGFIIGTWLRGGGAVTNRVDAGRVEAVARAIRTSAR
jgi:membrane complex biogenesis BtpA family protein